ncbi:MAG: transglycosylase SLT domain-containing protein [Gammaproteobacteria bacterium]|nr:transglycosylase SLT domain-containing protein [Gammaproteobacteria bacterium]
MKKNQRQILCSSLLLVSSGTFNQTTAETAAIPQELSAMQSTAHRFDQYLDDNNVDKKNSQDKLMLATADTYTDNKSAGRLDDIIAEHNSKQTEADTATAQAGNFSEEELVRLREVFMHAEKAVKKNNKAVYIRLADKLQGYPLLPYLQYQWLVKHLDDDTQIELFLAENASSRYAGKLKYKWLNHLAKHRKWPLYLQYYTQSNETSLSCYYHRALYNTGNKQVALYGAKILWNVGHSQPRQCDPLFAQLKKSSFFTDDLVWQRFTAAIQNNNTSLATYIKSLMPKSEQTNAQLWINLHRNPSHYMQQLLKLSKTPRSFAMFTHAIERLARKDLDRAIEIWDENKPAFIDENNSADNKQAIDQLERRLAFKLAYKGEPGAYERLSQLDDPDDNSKAWRVRTALAEQNWPNVITAINALDDTEKEEEKWQYWLARASLETGDVEQAEKLLSELSKQRSFYGYLAADKVNNMYQLSDRPLDVSTEQITELKNRKEFRVASELRHLDRQTEAKLQWWHAVSQLNNDEILVAAKLAQQWNWSEIAIFTIAKAKYWDDVELRFPLNYAESVYQNSAKQNLNPSILFGMIRRESAFNENAYSSVGARGLMQLMPQTARHIAKNLKERWRGSNSLYNPATNLKYGSYYYQKLLNKFDGHFALALAAYNAGPERVKQWLPEDETVPADIWIETIPYQETREYVIAVLAYTLIYQQRTQSEEQLSMNALTPDIQPLASY